MDYIKKNYLCGVCPGGCAVDIEMKDSKIAGVKPAEDSPYSAICLRGRYAPEVVYSPDRVLYPLIRDGEKGEKKFRRASWDEALDYIEKNVKDLAEKHGPETLFYHYGRGAFEQALYDYLNTGDITGEANLGFFEPLGSPNYSCVGSICFNSFGVLAPYPTFGFRGEALAPDLENADTIIVWGTNPSTGSPPFMFHRILNAKKRGAKIVTIDHFMSDIAKRSENAYLVRSGTDGALILCLTREVIERELYDKDFTENYCEGFDEYKEYLKEFTVEKTSKITGLTEEEIMGLFKDITEKEKTSILTYTGLEYSNSGVQSIRALYILWSIMGRLDTEGGLLINNPKKIKELEFMDNAKSKADPSVVPIGAEEYPLFYHLLKSAHFLEFPKAVLEEKPYKIRGLLNLGSSISTSYPNTDLYKKALKELDFFCTIDRFMTEDTKYADVVLPSTTYFEDESYFAYGNYLRKRERVIEPLGEAKSDMLILHEIADRLGYGEMFPKDIDELLERSFSEEMIEKLKENEKGFFIEPNERVYEKYKNGMLRKDSKPGFPTKSGKLEIKSSMLEEFGYPGLPEYMEPIESPVSRPDLYEKYPIVMNTGARIQTTFRSQHLNVDGLLSHQPEAEVLINTVQAEEKGIKDGEKVYIFNDRGKQMFTAKVTDGIKYGEVEVNMGGGSSIQSEGWKNSNINKLTDDKNNDYMSGFPIYKALLCDIVKVSDDE